MLMDLKVWNLIPVSAHHSRSLSQIIGLRDLLFLEIVLQQTYQTQDMLQDLYFGIYHYDVKQGNCIKA